MTVPAPDAGPGGARAGRDRLVRCVRVLPLLGFATLLVAGAVRGQTSLMDPVPVRVRSAAAPARTRLGDRVLYRGMAMYPGAASGVQWLPPEPDSLLTWGAPRAWRAPATRGAGETLFVELPLQSFRLGAVTLPGLRFQSRSGAIRRLPGVTLMVVPVLAAADSNAELKPARGPIAAPWYERVPWRWVLLGLAVLLAIVGLVRWLRARRRVPATAPAEIVLDPAARALAELAVLRARQLPAHGEFDVHAFELTRILRRYLEAVTHVPRPGHTTPELLGALGASRLAPAELEVLGGLLRMWDRIKFARGRSTPDEAVRAEAAVERLVRQLAESPVGRAA